MVARPATTKACGRIWNQYRDLTRETRRRTHDDDGNRVPGLGVSTRVESEDQAADSSEDEDSSDPVHVQRLVDPRLERALFGLGSERR
jgi:hypothetical protein